MATRCDAEGGAHVAERHISDLPLAVPQHRRLDSVERLPVDQQFRRLAAFPPHSILAERGVHGEHAIDRRLEAPASSPVTISAKRPL